jgi:hypothetical protein
MNGGSKEPPFFFEIVCLYFQMYYLHASKDF